jgi:hypothetical protein
MLQGVLVIATRTNGPGNESSWALTDNNGLYEITQGLPTGTYDVTAGVYALLLKGESAGIVTKKISGVAVTEVKETVNVDFDLLGSKWISGTVTTSTGLPVFRALVTANSTDGKYSGYEYTDVDGLYRITTGIPAGSYTVSMKYNGYSGSRSVTVRDDDTEVSSINFQLNAQSYGNVIGRVTDVTVGKPIGGALVRIAGTTTVETRTDPKGYYSYFLNAGSYVVTTVVPGFVGNVTNVQVTANQVARVYYPTASSLGFLVNKVSGASSGRVSGTVTGVANPIPEFPIAVVPTLFSAAILIMLLALRKIRRSNINKN